MSSLVKSPRSQLSSPYYSDDDFDLYPPSGKRLAPVGAASNEDEDMKGSAMRPPLPSLQLHNGGSMPSSGCNSSTVNNQLEERLRRMEEDQEELNSSLMSLTSHFAKVTIGGCPRGWP